MPAHEPCPVFDLGDPENWEPTTSAAVPVELASIGPCVARLLHNYAVQYLQALSDGMSTKWALTTAIMSGGKYIERAARPHELSVDAYREAARLFEDYIKQNGEVAQLLRPIEGRLADEPPYEILPPRERRSD